MSDGLSRQTTQEIVEHNGRLAAKITRTSVGSIFIGCIMITVVFVADMFIGVPGWTKSVKEDMQDEEINYLGQLAQNKATFATEVFSRIKTDVLLLNEIATAALSTTGGTPMKSHPGIPDQGWSTADNTYVDQGDGDYFSWAHSNWYLPGRAGAEHAWDGADMPDHTKTLLGQIAVLDMAFRSLREQYGAGGTLLYIGLEDPDLSDTSAATDPAADSIYKTFPAADMCSYSIWPNKCKSSAGDFICVSGQSQCQSQGHRWETSPNKKCDPRWETPPSSWRSTRVTTTGPNQWAAHPEYYDPRCRGWYQDAREAGGIIFTSPYTDANTGKLVMTAAVPLYRDPGTNLQFAGVVAVDFSIFDLQESILEQQIMDGGYAYVMAAGVSQELPGGAGAVIHKGVDLDGDAQTIAALEGIPASTQFIHEMRMGCSGTTVYEKPAADGEEAETWLMSYAPETAVGLAGCENGGHGYGYSIGLTVSNADLEKPFVELQDTIVAGITFAVLVLVICVAAGLCVMTAVARKIGRETAKPVTNLLRLVKSLNAHSDFITKEGIDKMAPKEQDSPELTKLVEVFRKMVTVVQAANSELEDGNFQAALTSYEDALELFTTMKNQKGIGKCNNNIAVAHMEKAKEAQSSGDIGGAKLAFGNAKLHLRKAIESARSEVKATISRTESQGGGSAGQFEAKKSLAHRLFVLANVLVEEGDPEEVVQGIPVIEEALKLGQQTNASPDRLLVCMVMRASMMRHLGDKSVVEGQTASVSAPAWDEAVNYVNSYTLLEPSRITGQLIVAPPKCVLQQKLYAAIAKDAEMRGDSALADERRIQCLLCGPWADLHALLPVAQALAHRGSSSVTTAGKWSPKKFGEEALKILDVLVGGTGTKGIMFVLDYSGSMAGGQIRACVESIQMIFSEHMTQNDPFALTVFNNSVQPKVPWMKKSGGGESAITAGISQCTRPRGGTALWDALCHAAQVSQLPPADDKAAYYICLLTDGEDNGSRQTPVDCKRQLQELTAAGKLDGLVAIAAGSGVQQQTKDTLTELAAVTKHGMQISTGADTQSLKDAFVAAAKAMENTLIER